MVNTLRRFSKPIMLVITVLVIVSFTVWGPNMNLGSGGGTVEVIYGKPVTVEQFQRQSRKFGIYTRMGSQYAMLLEPNAARGQFSATGVIRSFVFEREADNLGITATQEEKMDAFLKMPAFRGPDGAFSEEQFDSFVQNVLNPAGYSKDQMDEFVTGEVRMRRARDLIGAAVSATPDQVKEQFRQYQMKVEASYVELKQADFGKDITVSDEELLKTYNERANGLMTPEQRKVRYAAFLLPPPPDNKPYPTAKQTELQQQVAGKAYALREALEKKDANFEELAKQMGAKIGKTEFFAQDDAPEELEHSEAAGEAAFAMTFTKATPYSIHLTAEQGLAKGAYVLAYDDVKAPAKKTLDMVKEQLTTEIKKDKTIKVMMEKAKELRTKLEEAQKGGKSFYEAVESLGQKPVQFPVFGGAIQPPRGTPHATEIYQAVAQLAPGQLSEPTPAGDSVLIVHLDQRTAGEETPNDKKMVEQATKRLDAQLNNIAFVEWMAERTRAAGVVERPSMQIGR